MKFLILRLLFFALLLIAVIVSPAFAEEYHIKNQLCAVARCNGCHTTHNSQGGQLVDSNSPSGNPNLMKGATPTDTCLACHSKYGQCSTDGQTITPGGDFFWTAQDVTWTDSSGSSHTVKSREHGHNLNGPGHGLSPDDLLTKAPGGTYESSMLGCHSCHDPHGNTNFRFLYGVGLTATDYPGGYRFSYPAPLAQGDSPSANERVLTEEKSGQHTAYISGMSDWCANCHQGMHSEMSSNIMHPTDRELGTKISSNYNAYITTGNTRGDPNTAYLPLVPYEDAANTSTSTAGARAASRVMCLTCHRAHASPYPDAGRWDFEQTFLKDGSATTDPYLTQYNGNPLDLRNQRSLCNKCHVQDDRDFLNLSHP